MLHNGHIGNEQLDLLSRQPDGSAELWSHIESCVQCMTTLEKYRRLNAKLDQLAANGVRPTTIMNCPDESIWLEVAAGTLSTEESLSYSSHAATCDSCAKKLRAAIRIFNPEVSEEEEQVLDSLPAKRSQEGSESGEDIRRLVGNSTSIKSSASRITIRRPFWRLFSYGIATAFIVVVLLPWTMEIYRKHEIISAYREGRPMNYRLADIPYGPTISVRAIQGTRERYVSTNVKDPRFEAAAFLLRLNSEKAIITLENARKSRMSNVSLLNDLVVAYAMEAEHANSHECQPSKCYQHALDLSAFIIANYPQDPVAYFNRGLILKTLKKDYSADIKAYLILEKDKTWIADANRLLPTDPL